MIIRSAIPATFDDYLAESYPDASCNFGGVRSDEIQDRQVRLQAFPYSVLLRLAFAELDYANRWCWQQFGPAQGMCYSVSSEYPVCNDQSTHSHQGTWMSYWLAKTDYDFGFNEWHFAQQEDLDRFVEFVPKINWGECFPK
jgi:hypothetical protein